MLAELLELAPAGVEESIRRGRVRRLRGAGELPALPELRAAAGAALVEVSRRPRSPTTGPSAGALPQAGDDRRAAARAPAVGPAPGPGLIDIAIDPARRSAPARTTRRASAWRRCSSSSPAVLSRPRLRLGRARDRRGKLGWAPVLGVDHDRVGAGHARQRARNGVAVDGPTPRPPARRTAALGADRRREPPAPAPAARRRAGLRGRARTCSSPAACSPARPTRSRRRSRSRPARARPRPRRRVGGLCCADEEVAPSPGTSSSPAGASAATTPPARSSASCRGSRARGSRSSTTSTSCSTRRSCRAPRRARSSRATSWCRCARSSTAPTCASGRSPARPRAQRAPGALARGPRRGARTTTSSSSRSARSRRTLPVPGLAEHGIGFKIAARGDRAAQPRAVDARGGRDARGPRGARGVADLRLRRRGLRRPGGARRAAGLRRRRDRALPALPPAGDALDPRRGAATA